MIHKDDKREERILMEVIDDAHDAEEQAMGWYYYLDDKIQFPFTAQCIEIAAKSPLLEGEQVTVMQLPSADKSFIFE